MAERVNYRELRDRSLLLRSLVGAFSRPVENQEMDRDYHLLKTVLGCTPAVL